MNFDELMAAATNGELVFPGSWGQGRATYGGLVAAAVVSQMQRVVAAGRSLRSLQVSFVGPVAPGVPVGIEVEMLREGKAVSQVQGKMTQEGQVCLVVLGSFGGSRESRVQVAAEPEVLPSPPETLKALPYIKGMTPEFFQHVDMRWAFGGFPFTGNQSREMGGWMRFNEPPRELDDATLVALVDAWPPAVLPHLSQPAPASSLSWSLEFLYPRPQLESGDWLLYRASIDQAGAGYGHTHANIWSQNGELLAISRQTVTVFG